MTSKTDEKSGSHSWPLIIFLLIIFWPVGVFFLVRKLRTDKKASLSSGRKMMIWGWIIVGGGLISSGALMEDGWVSGIFGTLFYVAAGLALIYFGKKSSIRAEKYKKYIDLIVNKKLRSIGTIASAIPTASNVAISDIEDMIKKGFFEDAYINYSADEIVLITDEVQDQNLSITNQKVKMNVIPCNGCGANNKVVKGQVGNCQYCGSLISG
ncbi:hypothetical protein [Sporosarcina ureilytica]|uniref:Uncharacterized protein n=1 Tax=Sporosarcina ureilytica TaxID=298596 RepID=A0A1D8JEL2_9BACL|nr:hypothetical protein [Sporosarcina ureilytica]AOV07128.1 hypothetical protein BI350_05945 [Sporosarcina ureilytica]